MDADRIALIGLGTNMPYGAFAGRALLEAAISAIGAAGVKVVARSSFWTSPAWPKKDPPDPAYTNAVVVADAAGWTAEGLYVALAGVERAFGRERRVRYAARTLDLDILDFAGAVEEGALTLPHPRLQDRAFVLKPLAEVAPGWRHPALNVTAEALLVQTSDADQTRRID